MRKSKDKINLLPDQTIIEVIKKENGKVYKKEMTLAQAKELNKKYPSKYQLFQKGFSEFHGVIEKK